MQVVRRIFKLNLMLSFSKYGFVLASLLLPVLLSAQHCDLSIKGHISDRSTGIALSYSGVYNINTEDGVIADSLGNFLLENLCSGVHRLRITHIGCETREVTVSLQNDTTINIYLDHHAELLNEVVVHGKSENNTAQVSNTIKMDEIHLEGNKNLADIIEKIQGVSILKTGSGISKPVIHGMYGNRVTILNNGIAQSGQQWGNDHSPEIDPFVANHISVVKGASSLLYSSNSLGGVILVEPSPVPIDPVLSGFVNYIFQTNGRGQTLNASLARHGNWAAWRVMGTLKFSGDAKSPDYYLTNTGKQEANLAIQLEKELFKNCNSTLYYSMYNTNIGILRGSHIGNTSDLEEALSREEPFFTGDKFSFSIASPHQEVHHHLLKFESRYIFSENQSVTFKYGGQIDVRKEYDVRRGGRSDIPALSLWQNNQFIQTTYEHLFAHNFTLKTALQFDYTDNANDPETGILPLIPDYRSYSGSYLVILKKKLNKLLYEIGARYDLKKIHVWSITHELPRTIDIRDNLYHNYSLSTGAVYEFAELVKANLDLGYVLRSPEVNELYSFGLHQGVSGIEIGNPDLNPEKSLKLVFSADWNLGKSVFLQTLGYFQNIEDYIYLQPQSEFELTIRGAFPVFEYEQTNAQIIGSDLLCSFEPIQQMKIILKYSVLKGTNTKEDIPLVYMPPNNGSGTFTYNIKDQGKWRNNSVSVEGEYFAKQKNYLEGQDYLPPPDGYFLLNMRFFTSVLLKNKNTLKLSIEAENLLNKKYRSYMNRQRYFADDLGRNIMFKVSYIF